MEQQAENIRFVDTHAHLQLAPLAADVEGILTRAAVADVLQIITVGTTVKDSHLACELAKTHPGVYFSAGVHPHDSDDCDETTIHELEKLLKQPRCVALGEIGLDYFKEYSPRQQQLLWLEKQLELAEDSNMPVILHVRDAFEDAFAMLAGFKGAAVFHCFSGDVTEAEKICEMNQYISMTGTLTFGHRKNKNQKAARVLEAIPLEKLMLETDCPWMAPEPQRGKRNEPSFVPYIAQVAAELKQISLVDFACQTTKNAEKFFSLEDTWKLPASS